METFIKENSSAAASISGIRQRGWPLLACIFVVALSACSSESAAEAEPADTPAAVEDSAVEESRVSEPLAPEIEVDGVSPFGQKVLSEQGEGSGTHVFEGVLEAGQVLSFSASCIPGDSVSIDYGMGRYTVACSNPASSYSFKAPSSEPVENVEVTVRTPNGAPYWLAAWVHEAQ